MVDESVDAEFHASKSQCWNSNLELLESLREDNNSHELHQLAIQDHELGRMSEPVPVESIDLCSARYHGCAYHLHLSLSCAFAGSYPDLAWNRVADLMGLSKSGQ